MRALRATFLRILGVFGARRGEDDLGAELQSHIDLHTSEGVRAGLSPEEARRQALIRLGGAGQVKQAYRERGTLLWLECILRDVRFALRQLRKSPGFAFAAVVTLALGIGANAAVFSIVEAVLLRPLPYKNPDRLVVIWQADPAHRASGGWFDTYREFEAWKQNSRSFERLAALTWATGPRSALWQGKPIDLLAIPASVDFFDMLGVNPQIGRTFAQSDLRNGCTLVLSHAFWEQKLGSPGDIIGQGLKLGDTPCQVVGVMAKNFSFYPTATDAWTLITPTSEFAKKPWDAQTGAFGLLKPGVTRAAAEAELAAIQ
ncbi:MAG: ABC transporter permease, partial [Terracidiphilus sp.]